MKVVDVLLSVQCLGDVGKSFYHVVTVSAGADAVARSKARGLLESALEENGHTVLCCVVHGVAAPGVYDQFIGKYVGQFIDEALCRE